MLVPVLIFIGMWFLAHTVGWFLVYGQHGAKWNWKASVGLINSYADKLEADGWCVLGDMYETDTKKCQLCQTIEDRLNAMKDIQHLAQIKMAAFDEVLRAPESP